MSLLDFVNETPLCCSVRPSVRPSSLPPKWFIPCPKKFHCFLLEPESIFINNIPVGCCQNKGNNLVARDFLRLEKFYCICTPQHYWNQIIYRFFFSKCIIKTPYQLWCEWKLNKQQNCVFSAAWKIPNIGCYLQLATGADVLILEYFFAHSIFIQARRKTQQLKT